MNTTNTDGGPAFPHAQRLWDNDAQSWAVHSVGGMTLRDYFAAAALQGMLANPGMGRATYNALPEGEKVCDEFARVAYSTADAMLTARGKEEG